MNYNKLGKTDIEVSELGFGAWSIALDWWGKKIEEDEAKRKAQLAAIFENLPQEIKDVFNSFGPKLNEYSLRSQYDYFSEKYPKLKWEEVKKAYEEFKKINGDAADAVSNNENGAD